MNLLAIIILTSCGAFNASLCDFSQERVKAIQHQRIILKDLKDKGQLGKKKSRIIDLQLAKEEALEKIRSNNRCAQ